MHEIVPVQEQLSKQGLMVLEKGWLREVVLSAVNSGVLWMIHKPLQCLCSVSVRGLGILKLMSGQIKSSWWVVECCQKILRMQNVSVESRRCASTCESSPLRTAESRDTMPNFIAPASWKLVQVSRVLRGTAEFLF